jgi:hypothetical protein
MCKISTGLGFKFFIVLCLVQMHTIIDEIIFGGQVLETSSTEVMKAIEEISKCPLSLSLSLSLSVACVGFACERVQRGYDFAVVCLCLYMHIDY